MVVAEVVAMLLCGLGSGAASGDGDARNGGRDVGGDELRWQ